MFLYVQVDPYSLRTVKSSNKFNRELCQVIKTIARIVATALTIKSSPYNKLVELLKRFSKKIM